MNPVNWLHKSLELSRLFLYGQNLSDEVERLFDADTFAETLENDCVNSPERLHGLPIFFICFL